MAPRPSSESLIAGFLSQYSNPSTREVYSIAMRDLGDWAVTHGVANIADVQKPHLDLYGRHLEDEGLKPNSRASKQGVIKRFFAYLVDSGTIRQSPVPTGWVPRQEPRKALEVLAGEDMDAMFRAAREHKDFLDVGMFVALSGWDGLTVGHIMGIVAEDVRLDSDGTRCVPIRRKDGTIQNKPLSPQSSNHVATVLKGRPSGRLCYPTRPVEAARSAARRGLRSVAREAGIPGQMNSTRLWWSYRSRMLEAGTPIEVLLAAVGRDGSSGGALQSKGRPTKARARERRAGVVGDGSPREQRRGVAPPGGASVQSEWHHTDSANCHRRGRTGNGASENVRGEHGRCPVKATGHQRLRRRTEASHADQQVRPPTDACSREAS